MRYSLTNDLRTGNDIIDTQHSTLFGIINDLFDACEKGHGRESIVKIANFLQEYVSKHFLDEEKLQLSSSYPDYKAHKQFHQEYKAQLNQHLKALNVNNVSIIALSSVNKAIAQLVTHIKTEDKKIAAHIKAKKWVWDLYSSHFKIY